MWGEDLGPDYLHTKQVAPSEECSYSRKMRPVRLKAGQGTRIHEWIRSFGPKLQPSCSLSTRTPLGCIFAG